MIGEETVENALVMQEEEEQIEQESPALEERVGHVPTNISMPDGPPPSGPTPADDSAGSSGTPTPAATFNCVKCSKSFANINSHKRHMKDHHSPDRQCTVCQKGEDQLLLKCINYYAFILLSKSTKLCEGECLSVCFPCVHLQRLRYQ